MGMINDMKNMAQQIGNYLDDFKYMREAGAQRVKKEIEESLSPEMNRTRETYKPADQFIPKPVPTPDSTDASVQVLNKGWQMSLAKKRPDAGDTSWEKTQVPGQWALHDSSLFNHGGNVWYMKKFTITPDQVEPGKKLQLEFKGVDYKAEVFLNDKKLGEHEGYFTPFKFDITDKVKSDQPNILQVKVTSEEDKGAPFLKTQIKGIFGQHDARPGGAGSKSNIGNTGGIWDDVILRSTGMQTIENSYVSTDLSPDHKKADLGFHYNLYNHEDKEKEVQVQVRYRPQDSKNPDDFKYIEQKVSLKPGFNQVSLKTEEKDPQLWWTWDHGKPNLYEMETAVMSGDQLSQRELSHFGIRKVEMDPKTQLLKLNDKPVYQRGTNYIPTQWLSSYSPEDYAKDVKMMKDANLNAVRVHAHVLPHEFYDLTDKEGVLVYADFPLIWGVSPGPGTLAKAKAQYTEFVERYRNHPSIWLWNVHNESLPYNYFQDKAIQKAGEQVDSSRPHKRNSGFFDHFYPGWYDWYGKNYTGINRFHPKLPTEYGAEAIPKSAKEFIPQKDQWTPNESVWKYHDFQPGEMQRRIGEYKAYKNLDEFIETSQKYQYDLNKHITEYFRRNKYKPTTGIYQFMFKEAWPSITWAVADHNRNPKMAYQGLKESMAPTIVSIEWDKNKFKPGETFKAPLWIVNDEYKPVNGAKLEWKVYSKDDPEKKPLSQGQYQSDIPEDSSRSCCSAHFTLPDDAKTSDKWVLYTELKDSAGNLISKNDLIFGVKPTKKNKKGQEIEDSDDNGNGQTQDNGQSIEGAGSSDTRKKGEPFKYEPIHEDYPPVG